MDSKLRTRVIRQNSVASAVVKGIQILVNLFLVRILLDELGEYEYGLWITISSVLSWLSLANIGLGHGMRNKVAEAIANGNSNEAQTLISTTYALLAVICTFLVLCFLLVNSMVNWNAFFNVNQDISSNLSRVLLVVSSSIIFQFLLGLLNSVLGALHKVAISNVITVLGQALVLLALVWTRYFDMPSSLFQVSSIYSGMPVLILILSSIWFYKTHPGLKPRLDSIDLSKSKHLLSLGGKFFVLQIAAIILFTTDSYIISKLFSPEEVVPYNIAFRYFSLISVVFTTLAAPFWSGTTDAYVKGDFSWIQNSIRNLIAIWLLCCIAIVFMVLFSGNVYNLWLGKELHIPILLTISFGIYVLVNSWNAIFSAVINGIGELNLSYRIAIFGALVNIPLSIYLSKNLGFGVVGVAWATVICQLVASILIPIQCFRLIRSTNWI